MNLTRTGAENGSTSVLCQSCTSRSRERAAMNIDVLGLRARNRVRLGAAHTRTAGRAAGVGRVADPDASVRQVLQGDGVLGSPAPATPETRSLPSLGGDCIAEATTAATTRTTSKTVNRTGCLRIQDAPLVGRALGRGHRGSAIRDQVVPARARRRRGTDGSRGGRFGHRLPVLAMRYRPLRDGGRSQGDPRTRRTRARVERPVLNRSSRPFVVRHVSTPTMREGHHGHSRPAFPRLRRQEADQAASWRRGLGTTAV